MPVTLETRENGRVQYYQGTDPWSMKELANLYVNDQSYRDSVNFRVHTMMDLSRCRTLPQGVLSGRTGAPGLDHPRAGYVVLVGFNRLAQALGEMALRLKRFPRARFFDTEEAAWAFLRDVLANEDKGQMALPPAEEVRSGVSDKSTVS